MTDIPVLQKFVQNGKLEISPKYKTSVTTLDNIIQVGFLQQLSVMSSKNLNSLDGIEQCKHLEILQINNSSVHNVQALSLCTSLISVDLKGNQITELPSQLPQTIKIMLLQTNKIASIQAIMVIKQLANLQKLSIEQNSVTTTELFEETFYKALPASIIEARPLILAQTCKNLVHVSKELQPEFINSLQVAGVLVVREEANNRIYDLNGVHETIVIKINKCASFQSCLGINNVLSSIKVIEITKTSLKSLDFLLYGLFERLVRLDLSANEIQNSQQFDTDGRFTYLNYLNLSNNPLENVDFVCGMSSLLELHLNNTDIKTVPLKPLVLLEKLTIYDTKLSNSVDFAQFFCENARPSIRTVELSNANTNQISKLLMHSTAKQRQRMCQVFALGENDVVDIPNEYDNRIVSFTDITHLREAKTIKISVKSLSSTTDLCQFTLLVELNLVSCGLLALQLPQLGITQLDVSGNDISGLTSLANVKCLTKLVLNNNKIVEPDELTTIRALVVLVHVELRDNPVLSKPDFKAKLGFVLGQQTTFVACYGEENDLDRFPRPDSSPFEREALRDRRQVIVVQNLRAKMEILTGKVITVSCAISAE